MTPTSESGGITPDVNTPPVMDRQTLHQSDDAQWDEMRQAWLNQSQDTGGGAAAGNDVIAEGAEPAADTQGKDEEEKAGKKNKRKSIFSLMSSKK